MNWTDLTADVMYRALVEKDSQFEGVFFAGVKTTGIFCRPTCTARKPKPENVEFFATLQQALVKGYRPCKICKPERLPDQTPPEIALLLNRLESNPQHKIKDSDLIAQGLEPNRIRRWFSKHYQMTFQAYQRMYRINLAFNKIQQGDSIMDAAYDSGFSSLSGFTDSFKTIFGCTPSCSKQQQVILLTRIETPIGTMFIASTSKGLCLLEFTDRKMLETELKLLAKKLNATITQGSNAHIELAKQQLAEYFAGTRTHFDVSLDLIGSLFQQRVWQVLQQIPYGETRSYQQQAEILKQPTAVRAVANANGMNMISIIIPCHRVIGSNGTLTGYGGGLWRKRWLLDLEQGSQMRSDAE